MHSINHRGYLRLNQIVGDPKKGISPIVPVCRATIWNWVRESKFPKPIQLSPSVTVWRASDIEKYIDSNGGCDEL